MYDFYRSRHMQNEPSHSRLEQNLAPAPVSNANEKTHISTGLWLCGDSTPQIASGPVGDLVCFRFLFLPNDSRFVEIYKGSLGNPYAFRPRSASHTNAAHC